MVWGDSFGQCPSRTGPKGLVTLCGWCVLHLATVPRIHSPVPGSSHWYWTPNTIHYWVWTKCQTSISGHFDHTNRYCICPGDKPKKRRTLINTCTSSPMRPFLQSWASSGHWLWEPFECWMAIQVHSTKNWTIWHRFFAIPSMDTHTIWYTGLSGGVCSLWFNAGRWRCDRCTGDHPKSPT